MAILLTRVQRWLPEGGVLPDAVWTQRHRWILGILWAHVPFVLVFAMANGEATPQGVVEAGAIALFATLAMFVRERRLRTIVTSIGLLTASAALVHLSGGVIEMHFHYFVMVGVITLYQSWWPFLIAIGYVVLQHGIAGVVDPSAVYNHEAAIEHPLRWAGIHGTFILAMSAAGIASWRLNESFLGGVVKAERELQQANDAMREFVATASHDLRTPLTSVMGFAQTLRQYGDRLSDEERRAHLEAIERGATHASRLVDDLLTLSQIQADVLPTRVEDTAIAASVRQAAHQAGVEVIAEIDEVLTVRVDSHHLERMLVNYLTNAQRYGRPPISVSADLDGSMVAIGVHDCGSGLPPEFVPRVFTSFARADPTLSGGTGLGLSIVRGLALANGGEAYHQRSDSGTCFGILLPLGTPAA